MHPHRIADHGQPSQSAHPLGKVPVGRETGRRISATAPEHVAADERRGVPGKPVEDTRPRLPDPLDERKYQALRVRNSTAEGWKKAAADEAWVCQCRLDVRSCLGRQLHVDVQKQQNIALGLLCSLVDLAPNSWWEGGGHTHEPHGKASLLPSTTMASYSPPCRSSASSADPIIATSFSTGTMMEII
jgi:hypothetical protein